MTVLTRSTRLAAALAAVALAVTLAACSPSSPAPSEGDDLNAAQQMASGGKLKACMAVDPPFSFQEGTEYKSFIPELLSRFEEYADVEIEFVASSYSTIVASLQSGKCAFIGADLHATEERVKVIDFTNSIIPEGSGDVIFIRGDETRFTELSDLDQPDVTIAILSGSASEENKKELPNAKFRDLANVPTATLVSELTSGKVDAFATSSYLAPALVAQYGFKTIPSLDEAPGGLRPVPLAWAARKEDGRPLLDLLNEFLADMEADGTIEELKATWLTLENSLKG